MIRIAEVPQEFLPKMPVQYPPHQGYSPMIEERAYSFFATRVRLYLHSYSVDFMACESWW